MSEGECRNGHPRVNLDGTSNTYVYPSRPGRKPRITCRICRDGLPIDRPPQEERVARLAAKEVTKVVPRKLNAFGELRFWGLCRAIQAERYPLRMAWLMSQLRHELVDDIRYASDLLARGIGVFDMHDGDPNRIKQTASKAAKEQRSNSDDEP
jgi:hypothetical protein